VRTNGCINWAGGLVFVSEALIGEPVAVDETEEGEQRVRYGVVDLVFIDNRGRPRRRKLEKPRPAVDFWTTPRVARRVHRRNSSKSSRLRKWPKVSARYPQVSSPKCQRSIRLH
jgi:hypothetical protein